MGFLLTDVAIAVAFLAGYMGVVALERRRARIVLARYTGRTTSGETLASHPGPRPGEPPPGTLPR
jgi:hypothetical protein